MKNIYAQLIQQSQKGRFLILLIDPDKLPKEKAIEMALYAQNNGGAAILIGSSLMLHGELDAYIQALKEQIDIPLILFPGAATQVSAKADAILLLSLLSGRNPEYLIGKHVESAFLIQQSGLDIIPTGYILVDGGNMTSVHYMTQSLPIPRRKNDIAMATALAGIQLGMQAIYLEAGSGADFPVEPEMIQAVKSVGPPLLWVGGGIRNAEQIMQARNAGADFVVVGSLAENNPSEWMKLWSEFNV